MAFFDWNHDGKKDWQDDFLEYQIYNDYRKKRNENGYSGGDSTGCGTVIITVAVIIFILWLIGTIMNACTPKCVEAGCENARADGSIYCYLHKDLAAGRYRRKSSGGSSVYDYDNNRYSTGSGSSIGTTPSSTGTSSYSVPSSSGTSSSSTHSSSGSIGGSGGGKLYSDTSSSSRKTSSSEKSSSEESEKYDPYDAKDYSDAEDFYYDNYDDFESYEDAEDYYDDVMDE